MEIETIKNKEQAKVRAISTLLHKLAVAESKDVANISKELRRWIRQFSN